MIFLPLPNLPRCRAVVRGPVTAARTCVALLHAGIAAGPAAGDCRWLADASGTCFLRNAEVSSAEV